MEEEFKVMAETLPIEEVYQHLTDLVKAREFIQIDYVQIECKERIDILTMELIKRINCVD